jgi:hypothetical protein
VGDVLRVARATAVNPANARAVIVELYELYGRPGWSLLFEDGQHDGFSPRDCEVCGVAKIGHEASVADYQFKSAVRLLADWRDGLFAKVWSASSDSIEETDDEAIVARMVEEMRSLVATPCEIVFRPENFFTLVGLVQLAQRHPDLTEAPREMAAKIVAAARAYFAACPTILEVIARGEDPACDREWPDPTGGVH